jgi:hypothetical protein
MAKRGGCWFERDQLKVHLGVEAQFRAARKAHPGFIVSDLAELVAQIRSAGYPVKENHESPDYFRVFVDDPFGNRVELMEPATR